VLAPLVFGCRKLAGGDVQRRPKVEHGAGEVREVIDINKRSRRTCCSPGAERSRRQARGRSITAAGGGDRSGGRRVDPGDFGRVASIPLIQRELSSRRSSWASRRCSGRPEMTRQRRRPEARVRH
jgi:hypothetical protein